MTNFLRATYHEAAYAVLFIAMFLALCCLMVLNTNATDRENVVPVRLVEEFETNLNEQRYQEAYEVAKYDDSMLGQVLSGGLANLSAGYARATEAMDEVAAVEEARLRNLLDCVGLIGVIGLLVGVFGSVHGTIAALERVADADAESTIAPLSRGLAKALIPLILGVAIATVSYSAHRVLERRVNKLVLEVDVLSNGLMSRFSNVSPERPNTGENEADLHGDTE